MVSRAFGGESGEGEAPRCFASRESIGIVGGCSESSVRNWRPKFTERQALRVAPRAGGGVVVFPAIARWVPPDERLSSRRPPEFEIDFRALERFCTGLDQRAAAFRNLKRGERAKRLLDNENARAMHGFTEGARALCGRGPRDRRAARAALAIAKGLSALICGAAPAKPKPVTERRKAPDDGPLREEWVGRFSVGDASPLTDEHRERYHALVAGGTEPTDAAALTLGIAHELDDTQPSRAPESASTPKPSKAPPAPRERDADSEALDSEVQGFIEDLVTAGMTPREAVGALLKARVVRQEQIRSKSALARGLESMQVNGALALGSRPMLD